MVCVEWLQLSPELPIGLHPQKRLPGLDRFQHSDVKFSGTPISLFSTNLYKAVKKEEFGAV
jgi:hypothetical protein